MRKILKKIGMRQAVGSQLLGRLWISIAELITIGLIASKLSRPEQGYYYVFFSFQSLENLFELGFRLVVLHFATHEAATLEWTPDRRLTGSEEHRRRLGTIVRFALRFYTIIAFTYMILVFTAGVIYFRWVNRGEGVEWLYPWIWMMLASGFTLFSSPFNLLLEGCGRVDESYRLRLLMSIFGSIATWVFLLAGLKLYANGAYVFFFGVPAAVWIFGKYHRFFMEMVKLPKPDDEKEFAKKLWKFQNRVGASSVAQFLSNRALTPIAQAVFNSTVAGQLGMALRMVQLIQTTGSAWIVTHAAPMGRLVATHKYEELDHELNKTIKQSIATSVVASLMALGAVAFLQARGYSLGGRILGVGELSFLALGTILQVLSLCYVYYSRAFKREPLLNMNLLSGVLSVVFAILGAMVFGTMGIAVGYAVVGLISAVWARTVVIAKRASWREEPLPPEDEQADLVVAEG